MPSLVFSREFLCFHVQFYPFPCTEFILNHIYSTQFPLKIWKLSKELPNFKTTIALQDKWRHRHLNSRDSTFQNCDRFQVLTNFNGREDNCNNSTRFQGCCVTSWITKVYIKRLSPNMLTLKTVNYANNGWNETPPPPKKKIPPPSTAPLPQRQQTINQTSVSVSYIHDEKKFAQNKHCI